MVISSFIDQNLKVDAGIDDPDDRKRQTIKGPRAGHEVGWQPLLYINSFIFH